MGSTRPGVNFTIDFYLKKLDRFKTKFISKKVGLFDTVFCKIWLVKLSLALFINYI